jgi:Zn-dependent metalloprotease
MKRIAILFALYSFLAVQLPAQVVKRHTPSPNQDSNPGKTGLNFSVKQPVPGVAEPLTNGPIDFKSIPSLNTVEGVTYLYDSNSLPIFFEGRTAASRPFDDAAQAAVHYASSLIPPGMKDPSTELLPVSVETDELGNIHVRLQQMWQGVHVFGGELIAHTRSGVFSMMNGRYFLTPELPTSAPALSATQCFSIVTNHYGRDRIQSSWTDEQLALIGGQPVRSELVVYHVDDHLNKEHLCWMITFFPNTLDREVYFIDAETGDVLLHLNYTCSLHHNRDCNHQPEAEMPPVVGSGLDLFNINRSFGAWQQGTSYYMIDAGKPMFNASASNMPSAPVGALITLDAQNKSSQSSGFNPIFVTSGSATFNNKVAVSAHNNAGICYDYFKNTFNRNSINGQGGNIISLVNVTNSNGTSMGNAYWNGQAMFYGNGDQNFRELARGLDVAGHEMTHGVVEKTANLVYMNEPGALNESFADIFGVMIDRDDWLIGEDVMKPGATPTNALRSMSDPNNGSPAGSTWWQPKNVSQQYFGTQDNGGVHINSGIPNYAFYLFATNPSVGKDRAEQVYYKALRDYMVKSSKFVDCRIAVIQAAQELHGQQVAQAAANAFTSVGILGNDPGGNYLGNLNPNPGSDFVLAVTNNGQNLDLFNGSGQLLGTIYNQGVASKPSINDNGTQIVFVNTAGDIIYVEMTYTGGNVTPTVGILSDAPIWRNAAISKDAFGRYVAAIKKTREPYVYIYDFLGLDDRAFFLYNPTTSQGGQASYNVNYADVLEFDYSGNFLMYDANNQLSQNNTYWDISFLKFIENNTWADTQSAFITKLFSVLPEKASVANPAFAKNAPYVIALDYYDEINNRFDILGANTETGNVGTLQSNNGDLGYASYSRLDNQIIYEGRPNANSPLNIYRRNLNADKISSTGSETTFISNRNWATWYANGNRNLSVNTITPERDALSLAAFPNPSTDNLTVSFRAENASDVIVELVDQFGRVTVSQRWQANAGENTFNLSLNGASPGVYMLRVFTGQATSSLQLVKI